MPTSLPRLLTPVDLPAAELQAAALDGDLFRLDQVWCSVAELDVPWWRAQAVFTRQAVEPGSLLVRLTAAWVWCVLGPAPPLELRARGALGRIDPADVAHLGPVAVTTPERTTVDLLRRSSCAPHERRAAARLAREARLGLSECEGSIARLSRADERDRVARRLERLSTELRRR